MSRQADRVPVAGPTQPLPAVPTEQSLPVRVVVDPMATLLTSLVEWFGPRRSQVPASIRRQATTLARRHDLSPLLAMVAEPYDCGIPTFLTRINHFEPVPTVRQSTELVRAQPIEAALDEINRTFGSAQASLRAAATRPWHHNHHQALTDLCHALDLYWYGVVQQIYPDAERRLRRAAQQLQDAVLEVGPQAAVASLHPKLRRNLASPSVPSSASAISRRATSGEVTEIVIKPILANRRTVCTNIARTPTPRIATFAIPTPALAVTVSPTTADPLGLLIGPTRADLIRRLRARPATTTGLAEATGFVPSTISHHLSAMSAAGVVQGERHGSHVLYSLTERGHRLLSA